QEEADGVGDASAAQLKTKRDQMIVVNPDHIAVARGAADEPGEIRVDLAVAPVALPSHLGEIETAMTERPQGPIGEAVVIALDVLPCQVDTKQREPLTVSQRHLARAIRSVPSAPAN